MKTLSIIAALFLVAIPAFAVNPTINGVVIFGDSAPTISACGTTNGAGLGTNTSSGGTVTVGSNPLNAYGRTVPVTTCKLTFASTYTAAPTVVVSTTTPGARVYVAAVTTTTLLVTFGGGDGTGIVFSWIGF